MAISETVKNVGTLPPASAQGRSSGVSRFAPSRPLVLAGFAAFFGVGTLAVLYPWVVLELAAAAAAIVCVWLGFRYLRRTGLEVWQMLVLIVLSGFLLFNYGFENLTIHVGPVPVIISYTLMFGALALGAREYSAAFRMVRKEPAVICLYVLWGMTALHWIFDIPRFGLWAVRDASLFLDAVFLSLGMLWARRGESITPLMKWMMVIFLLNGIYSLGLPWEQTITSMSPTSGVFIQVPIVGTYRGNGLYLLLGGLFYIFLGHYLRWPQWIIWPVAVLQFAGLALHQQRAMYVAYLLILIGLPFIGEKKKSGKLALLMVPPILGVVMLGVLGIEIQGRIGTINADFFKEHMRSITGASDTPGSSVEGRMGWYDQVFSRIKKNPWLGEGFGQPLIQFENDLNGATVRQPHNSTVTVLARLGIAGLVPWFALHVCVMLRFLAAWRARKSLDKEFTDFLLWLFMVYLVFMITAVVEATFEFPSAAIPFYFLVGLSLGLVRWQVPAVAERNGAAPVAG